MMKFEKIIDMWHITADRKEKTEEEVLEYEFYTIMNNLLDVLIAFETGNRDPMKVVDQQELLGELKKDYNWLKGNIECLKDYRKRTQ